MLKGSCQRFCSATFSCYADLVCGSRFVGGTTIVVSVVMLNEITDKNSQKKFLCMVAGLTVREIGAETS